MGNKYDHILFSHDQLFEWFALLDSRYFRFGKKKLATLISVEWSTEPAKHDPVLAGWTRSYSTLDAKGSPDKHRILINADMKNWPRISRGTLIHEMAHFKLEGKDKSRLHCGSRMFTAEMKRLAAMGALKGTW